MIKNAFTAGHARSLPPQLISVSLDVSVRHLMTPQSISRVREFSREGDYRAFAVVRAHNNLVADVGGRNTWVRISSTAGESVFRRIQGVGEPDHFYKDNLETDYETRLALGVGSARDQYGFYQCELTVVPATSLRERLLAHWRHPDPAYSISIRWAAVSVLLSLLGFICGIISLVK